MPSLCVASYLLAVLCFLRRGCIVSRALFLVVDLCFSWLQIWDAYKLALPQLASGVTHSIFRFADFQCFSSLWFESAEGKTVLVPADSAEVASGALDARDNQFMRLALDPYQVKSLTRKLFPEATTSTLPRCFELHMVFTGGLSVETMQAHMRSLVRMLRAGMFS